MPHIIRVERTGDPEVLKWVEVPAVSPGPGEVLLRQTAVGVNFIDVYYRSGLYTVPGGLPYVPGSEGVGIVEALGKGVNGLKVGDRVVYQSVLGGYAEERLVPADRVVKVPDDIDDKTAAAVFLKGVTAHCLLSRTYPVKRGTVILFHAAAGGVGSIACQWAASLGATVIGTVGSVDKEVAARKHGCAHVINYTRENFPDRVREITAGAGVDVVYDSIGKDTFPASLDCLKQLGLWVSFGQSSGLPPPFPVSLLQQKGSLFATRPTIAHYLAARSDLEESAAAVFAALKKNVIKVEIGQEFPLRDAAAAHRALAARTTVGATVLIP